MSNMMLRQLRSLLPTAKDYRGATTTWRVDVIAGLTVGIVALPLALAFGVASGVGAEAGLITAVVAGIVGAIFGGSPVQVSGPTGAMVVVLLPLVSSHGPGAVIIVGITAGIVLVLAALLKFGRLIGFIPWPVIEGFTAGIGIIIFLQQVPSALGATPRVSANTVLGVIDVLGTTVFSTTTWLSLAVVAIAISTMLVWPFVTKVIPGSFVAIVVSTLVVELGGWDVARIGTLPSSLPAPTFPTINAANLVDYAPAVVTVAALAAIESLLSARVASTMSTNSNYEPDRELFGQGIASIVSGLFGGMPATGAIARTAVNVKSGASSRLASMTHGVVLLGIIYVGTQLVSRIPLTALAGVLMVTAIRMLPIEAGREIVRSTRADAAVFFATIVITVAFDLIDAVVIGVASTAFFALRNLVRSSGIHREEIPAPHAAVDRHIALFRLDGALFFGAADNLIERLHMIEDVRVVVLRMAGLQFLDATGAHVLVDICEALEARGVAVVLKGIRAEHRTLMNRMGLPKSIAVFATLDESMAFARKTAYELSDN
jgi:SulP family sulfate permease